MNTRSYLAAINGEWAIQPEWIPRILEIAARENGGLQAVQAERGESLEYTYSVTVRDGVAIIPITGPIFRYANLFSYFSGGTSVSILARDFNTALNDPRVDSILFEINSPGGEVTGINELGNMIYNARGRKPMTARVGGLCASAAYWLGSACGDIVIDDTAMLGSIGVYSAYRDTKKRDAKEGLREIKIVSSQSPNKCPDPATPEGEKRIQSRVDALAEIFIETVARNREVTEEKVLSDFGQGDVFVGQAAIDAGLADRLGSFEETISDLARAHGPSSGMGYTGALYAEEEDGTAHGTDEHLVNAPGTDEASAIEARTGEGDGPTVNPEEQTVPEDEDDEVNPDHPGQDEDSAHAPLTTEKGAMEMATENTAGASEQNQPTIEQLTAQLAELTEKANAATAENNALKSEALTKRLQEKAAGFTGDTTAKVGFMQKLVASYGEDSDELKAYVEDQTAIAEQLKAGGLFKESGSSASDDASQSAYEKLEASAKTIAAEQKITPEQAFVKAAEANPELYRAYVAETQQG